MRTKRAAPPVTLTCWSNEPHLAQLFTGLTMLERQGAIELIQKIIAPPPPDHAARPHLVHVRKWHCFIDFAGKRFYVDTHDGDEIAEDVVCDVYLKRGKSLSATHTRVRALGLNYEVYADRFDRFEFERRRRVLGAAAAMKYLVRPPLGVADLTGSPFYWGTEPRVLFLCRTWEPNHPDPCKNAERVAINQQRMDIIMGLRRTFGARCLAGFSPTAHALREHRAAVMEVDLSPRRTYLQMTRSFPICVATMGLHGSNGWKLGEYVAHQRAIVSETLHHEVPGFVAGEHYLPFQAAEQCVEAVGRLMESPGCRQAISAANHSYYNNLLRPDRLVATAIGLTAVHQSNELEVAPDRKVSPSGSPLVA